LLETLELLMRDGAKETQISVQAWACVAYILAADVAEFSRRLASDEFAGNVSNPSRSTFDQTKVTKSVASACAAVIA
jgi:hypothetical protein